MSLPRADHSSRGVLPTVVRRHVWSRNIKNRRSIYIYIYIYIYDISNLRVNTTPHTATGFTPHELMFGRKPNILGLLQREPPETQYAYDSYIKELQSRLQSSYQAARISLESQKERSKEYHDRNINTPLFTVGDKVLLHDEKIRRGRSAKLSPPFIGPYEIIDVDDVNITLKLPKNRNLKVHANRLKPFFGWLQDHDTCTQTLDYRHLIDTINTSIPPMQHSKDSKNHQVYITTTLERLNCIILNGNF